MLESPPHRVLEGADRIFGSHNPVPGVRCIRRGPTESPTPQSIARPHQKGPDARRTLICKGGSRMKIAMGVMWWSLLGGLVGTGLMDLSGVIAKGVKFRWGG